MGRNQNLRRRIAGNQRMIKMHREKIRLEQMKLDPNKARIAHWREEIDNWEKQILRLTPRLKREW